MGAGTLLITQPVAGQATFGAVSTGTAAAARARLDAEGPRCDPGRRNHPRLHTQMREHLPHGPAELRLVRCGTFDQPLPPAGQLILSLPARAPEETCPPCRDPPDREHVSRRFGIARVKQQLGRHELGGPEALERLGQSAARAERARTRTPSPPRPSGPGRRGCAPGSDRGGRSHARGRG